LIGDPDVCAVALVCVRAADTRRAQATSAAAAASLQAIPDATGSLTGFSIAWAQGVSTYPIATFSYLMLRKDLTDLGQGGSAIKAFITFALSDAAQASAIEFGLVPLPQQILMVSSGSVRACVRARLCADDTYVRAARVQTNRAVVASIKISDQTAFMQYSSMVPNVIVIDGTLAPTPPPMSDAVALLSSSALLCLFAALQVLLLL
jgi:hypothetical protein